MAPPPPPMPEPHFSRTHNAWDNDSRPREPNLVDLFSEKISGSLELMESRINQRIRAIEAAQELAFPPGLPGGTPPNGN